MKSSISKLLVLFSLSAGLTFGALADPVVGKEAPLFEGTTSGGATISLEDFRGKPVMLEWTNHECPYVKKHYNSGNMQRTQAALTEDGVTWISVISSAPGQQGYVSADEANDLSESRGVYADYIVLDPDGTIGKLYKAKTTPHMFLIDADGTLQYMGAIDDQPSARESSLEGAKNYALAAWEALKAGETIAETSTKPYGCSVKYAD
ncbi:redoxin domain-containing protein [Kordiimonas gwangyangensis]|uniref:redoxin domain-containing protein n=1 Tax=Kordiimonas gwangyangensis TaxID=288022 RepID=UPI00035C8F96|nr:redoxin domain-containing protein [Kordiimonas gwangyangensis]